MGGLCSDEETFIKYRDAEIKHCRLAHGGVLSAETGFAPGHEKRPGPRWPGAVGAQRRSFHPAARHHLLPRLPPRCGLHRRPEAHAMDRATHWEARGLRLGPDGVQGTDAPLQVW